MTREEIIKWLESLKAEIGKSEHRTLWNYAEAIDMAIEALSEPSGGLISRADALKELNGACSNWEDDAKVAEIINALPSAKPKVVRVEYSPFTVKETSTPSQTSFRGTQEVKIIEIPSADRPNNDCVLTMFGECSYNKTGCSDCEIKDKIRKALADIPTKLIAEIKVDTEKIVKRIKEEYELTDRPQGEWMKGIKFLANGYEHIADRCTACGEIVSWGLADKYKYCPNCGAKMKGGAE